MTESVAAMPAEDRRKLALVHQQLRVHGNHPLIADHVGWLRDQGTGPAGFRQLVRTLTHLLLYEATRDLATREVGVKTPVDYATVSVIDERIGIVPVLRAGIGMAEAALDLLPKARVCHIGLKRNEETLQPEKYYQNLPAPETLERIIVVDPMLATGGSTVATLDLLAPFGVPMVFVGLIAAPEGVITVADRYPHVPLHVAALDSHLNEKGYIVPGLGDAGDRYFATT